MATVLLVAFTLAVAALVGGWLTSMSRTETESIESGFSTTVNCTKASIDIVDVNTDDIIIANVGPVDLSGDFAVVCGTNVNTSAGASATLAQGDILKITADNCAASSGDKIRVTSSKCPSVWAECTEGTSC